jgi:hypothetical protein
VPLAGDAHGVARVDDDPDVVMLRENLPDNTRDDDESSQ